MPPLEIQLIGDRELFAGLSRLEGSFSDVQPIIEKVGIAGLADTQHRFDVGGPGWTPHAESTRKKKIGPSRLLWDSGLLRDSFKKDAPQNIFKVDAKGGEFGSDVFYGIFHQEGRGHNPVRVIVDVDEHEEKYQQIFVNAMNERIRDAGFAVN